jgi:geranylgeranyl pyrophosphate synthase
MESQGLAGGVGMNDLGVTDGIAPGAIAALGFDVEIACLRETIAQWLADCDEEMRAALQWQFLGGAKYFRPLTVFSCYRAGHDGPIPQQIMNSALVIEFFHNVSLIIDDILDQSPMRRGRATLHARFGELPALMTAGYIVADGYVRLADDLKAIKLFSELLKRLGVAECMQWRLRRTPLGVEDWRKIAAEDTGSMFEVCACLGDRSGRLRRFGGLLGLLYHGCDDVGDVRGAKALGGGGNEDVRDGILTLPAALAIRDPAIAKTFCKPEPTPLDLSALAAAFATKLPEAEVCLDRIAGEARSEARLFAADPAPLLALVEQTRRLSAH